MSAPSFHGKIVPTSAILAALGDALSRIRHEDRLTWADLGAALGKSEDTVAKYADGSAEMGAVAFYRAKLAFGGRFTGEADALVSPGPGGFSGPRAQSCLLTASLALSVALEDGALTDAEIAANRSKLETCRDAIDALLQRLAPRGVA